MLNIERAWQSPRALQALTGVSRTSFEQLESRFAAVVSEQRAKRRYKRASGAGRKHTLRPLRAKLFFILLYLKCYPTFDVAGILFEVDRSWACRWGATSCHCWRGCWGRRRCCRRARSAR